MIDAPSVGYRIFVLCIFKKDPLLKPETDVLYQVLAILLIVNILIIYAINPFLCLQWVAGSP